MALMSFSRTLFMASSMDPSWGERDRSVGPPQGCSARRRWPVAFGDACPGPGIRSSGEPGRDEGAVPRAEPRNWVWPRLAIGGWLAKTVCGRTVL